MINFTTFISPKGSAFQKYSQIFTEKNILGLLPTLHHISEHFSLKLFKIILDGSNVIL